MRRGRCPQCSQPSLLETENRWRPFCSERCKLIDLGQWFEERYSIPAEDEPLSEDMAASQRRQ
ncbi:hypothetical protein SAMN04488038_107126 [Solimonas aquatica]|uniref:DNA gyrase inhibitor YacG n=1 Tax=Solimonas aquatica TaxID=489703 RepID=A0A1H9GLY5_9GAMM|nr:DNA gyrase inhibitor YacG [Solimonas aquatica]SEQ51111.1 hypothetical protein SAMN04488038_107126 [Solimonas aquatica]